MSMTDLDNGPEQLNLQDDPTFIPDFNINLDLSLFNLPLERSFSRGSGRLPSLANSSHASLSDHEPQLELPSDDAPGLGIVGFDFGAGTSSVGQLGSKIRATSIFEEPGIIDDPEFQIDADGNLFTPTQRRRQSGIAQDALASLGILGSKADSTGITDRVRAEHEAGLQGGMNDLAFDFNDQGTFMGDHEPLLPDAAPFSARQASSVPPGQHRQSSSTRPDQEVSSVIEFAPQRRARPKPLLKPDEATQIESKELKAWDMDYLHNMAAERRKHDHLTSTLPQAKKNAEHLVLGVGLSGLGREFDADFEHPLRRAFSGQALFDLLTGRESSPAGKKRGHASDENEDDEENRRVRPRSDDELQFGRREDEIYQFDDGDGILAQGDDDMPIEIGRHAPSPMPDIDSVRNSMPWNLSSRAGSARPIGLTSSAGALAGCFEPAFHLGRRLTSASPLLGRGKQGTTRYSSLEIPGPAQPQPSGDFGTFDLNGFQLPDMYGDEEFELHGPAAGLSSQQADKSQWLAKTLEDEANNFFAFLRREIEQRRPVWEKPGSQELGEDVDDGENGQGMVTFEELLPPKSNSKAVAAQGLLHVLTLVTRGAIKVLQEEDFGSIEMSIVPGVRLVERREEEEGREIEEIDLEMEEQESGEAGQGDGPEDGAAQIHGNESGDADDDEDMYG